MVCARVWCVRAWLSRFHLTQVKDCVCPLLTHRYVDPRGDEVLVFNQIREAVVDVSHTCGREHGERGVTTIILSERELAAVPLV